MPVKRKRRGSQVGIAQLDGFVESLRLLVAREEYCLTDIALMFGVSTERVRQLCVMHNIPRHHYPKGLNAERVWDDAANRFRPVPYRDGPTLGRVIQRKRSRAQTRAHIREEIRKHIEATALAVYRRVGRPVRTQEVMQEAMGRPLSKNECGARLRSFYALQPYAVVVRGIEARTGVPWCRRGKGARKRLDAKGRARREQVQRLRAEHLTYAEIARRTGLNRGTVWMHLNRPPKSTP